MVLRLGYAQRVRPWLVRDEHGEASACLLQPALSLAATHGYELLYVRVLKGSAEALGGLCAGTRVNGVIGDHQPPYKVVKDVMAAREHAGGLEKALRGVCRAWRLAGEGVIRAWR